MEDIIKKADCLLEQIAASQAEADKIKKAWEAAIQELEKQYGEKLKKAKQKIKDLEKQLIKLAKTNVSTIFDSGDKRELDHGVLIYEVAERVKRARTVTVEKLKELGYIDGVKVTEKVDWDVLEKWPEEKLIAVGTERVRKEDIKYEVKRG